MGLALEKRRFGDYIIRKFNLSLRIQVECVKMARKMEQNRK